MNVFLPINRLEENLWVQMIFLRETVCSLCLILTRKSSFSTVPIRGSCKDVPKNEAVFVTINRQ